MDEKKQFSEDAESTFSLEPPNRRFKRNEVLLVTSHGKVYAVSKADGSRYWRTPFPGGGLVGPVSIFVTNNDCVLIGCQGKMACLALYTGELKWVNKMKGMGVSEVGIISTFGQESEAAPWNDGDADDLPPSYEGASVSSEKQVVLGTTRGKVLAVDPETGESKWRFDCPGGGFSIPSLLVEPRSKGASKWPFNVVYVGCGRWLYCLQAANGNVLWTSRITNGTIGHSFVCLATPWTSRLRAEVYTDFSSIPHGDIREAERKQAPISPTV
ncbi:quinon protein alcohol dehydrogenase-like superfamily [Gongronella butleri]|nr:quinon protein alcohol dehydrogenase-like superfamily [Gongronella butleri]